MGSAVGCLESKELVRFPASFQILAVGDYEKESKGICSTCARTLRQLVRVDTFLIC
jgi:hypothetical protein